MSDNRFFIRWTLFFLLVAAGVGLCYAVVDAPLARWAHQHQLRRFGIFHGLQMVSDLLVVLLVPALLVTGWRRYRPRRFTVADRLVWHAALAVGAVSLLKYPLKFAFGRAWPETFYHGNPSLLSDGIYGFFPFHGATAYGSFPSGHAAVAAAAAAVIWRYAPRYRVGAVGLWVAVAVGLLGAYYHFAGDILAGTWLGLWVAALVVRFDAAGPDQTVARRE